MVRHELGYFYHSGIGNGVLAYGELLQASDVLHDRTDGSDVLRLQPVLDEPNITVSPNAKGETAKDNSPKGPHGCVLLKRWDEGFHVIVGQRVKVPNTRKK